MNRLAAYFVAYAVIAEVLHEAFLARALGGELSFMLLTFIGLFAAAAWIR